MAVLVTGGAGYIGSHTVWSLVDRGEKVIVIDDLSTGFDWSLPPQVDLIVGDAGNQPLVQKALQRYQVDAVIHFAGSLIVSESVSDPLAYYRNNTLASHNLIEAAVRQGVKHLVFSSSAAVYGTPEVMPVSENAATKPQSPYGRSKLMTEIMLEDVGRAHSTFRYTSLRYFNVAGADPDGRTGESTKSATHLIKAAAQAALGLRKHLELYGTDYQTEDGTCVRDYIHVTDLAEAHIRALDRLREGEGSLIANLGYGRGYSVREVIQAVQEVSGVDFEVREQARRLGDPARIVADPTVAQRALKWSPRLDDIKLIVAHALAWERTLIERRA